MRHHAQHVEERVQLTTLQDGSPQLVVPPPAVLPPALWPPLMLPPLLLPGTTPEQHAALLAFAQQQQAALAALAAATAGVGGPAAPPPMVETSAPVSAPLVAPEPLTEVQAEEAGGPIQCKTRRTLPESIAEQLGLGQGQASPGMVVMPVAPAPLEATPPAATAAAT